MKELEGVFFNLLCRRLVLKISGNDVISDIPRGDNDFSALCFRLLEGVSSRSTLHIDKWDWMTVLIIVSFVSTDD